MSALMEIYPLPDDASKWQVRGEVGKLTTALVGDLRIDLTYQRAVTVGSIRTVRRICADFDWSKFLPIIAVRDGEFYSVVDGQHRTIAAKTLGIERVPVYVLSCSPAQAAAAFAAINGNVTPVSPVDIWFAELAAGDPDAISLNGVLEAAGAAVVRKKDGYAPGETRSINVLRRAHRVYGEQILTTILQCIVECGNGNPGMLIGSVINGVGKAIFAKPELLAEPSKLFTIFDGVDLSEVHDAAKAEAARTGNVVQAIITRKLNETIRRGTSDV